jgi:hypothetical protein
MINSHSFLSSSRCSFANYLTIHAVIWSTNTLLDDLCLQNIFAAIVFPSYSLTRRTFIQDWRWKDFIWMEGLRFSQLHNHTARGLCQSGELSQIIRCGLQSQFQWTIILFTNTERLQFALKVHRHSNIYCLCQKRLQLMVYARAWWFEPIDAIKFYPPQLLPFLIC